jgi:hypothetical protein
MNTNDVNEKGTAEPCYMLTLLNESKNESSTTESGYKPDNPLIVKKGSYGLWIKMIADYQPYEYSHLHVRATKPERIPRSKLPFFNTKESTRIAIVFKSDSGPEKSQKVETTPLHDDLMFLEKHSLALGDLHILLVGYIPVDIIEYNAKGDPVDHLTDFLSVNLDFWLRVVD